MLGTKQDNHRFSLGHKEGTECGNVLGWVQVNVRLGLSQVLCWGPDILFLLSHTVCGKRDHWGCVRASVHHPEGRVGPCAVISRQEVSRQ